MPLNLNFVLTVPNAAVASAVLASCAALYIWRVGYNRSNKRLPHPPGPPGFPLIGNLLDVPKEPSWVAHLAMSKKYDSDIIRLNVMGTNLIVLNSAQAVTDLLEKRSSNYSDRSRMVMLNELVDYGWSTTLLRYNALWKDHRRAFHQYLGPETMKQFRSIEEHSTIVLLEKLLRHSEGFSDHLRHMAGGTILRIAYGIEAQEQNDPFMYISERSTEAASAAINAGSYMVDILPFLKYVPEWVPGAGFQKQAREWKHWATEACHIPYNIVKHRMEQGVAVDCVGTSIIENMVKNAPDAEYAESAARGTLGTMYVAGVDTVVSTIRSFILAVMLQPDIQRKAQAEIDLHCSGRLPTFADYDVLQYCHALVKEALRWHPIVPLAVPHQSSSDDFYKGYYIPKGSIVVPNSWAILRDETAYQEPHVFNPDRFLKDGKIDPDVLDPATASFGYGRRICPGRHLAYESVWLAIASILAVFNFAKAKDAEGNEITPGGGFTAGFMS
ncbi:cytochrome P450 [Trametopsis cervina]|nr:cytochrome P450 [Trametopsis cervina]